jgi:hypothetical protein
MEKEVIFNELLFQLAQVVRGEEFDGPQTLLLAVVSAPWYPSGVDDDTRAEITLALADMGADPERA